MSQRVIITAGAGGIGLAMARAFVSGGAKVWVTDVDGAALDALPDGIVGRAVDVTDEAAMAGYFDIACDAMGGLDVLCANAGIKGPTAPLEAVSLADWRTCIAVGLDGAFLATKYAAPVMKRQGGGALIYTSSTAGQYGFPNRAPYAAAKWGLHGLMKTAAMELGPHGVRANAILPGSVEGPRIEAVLEAEAAAKGTTRDAIYAGYVAGTSLRTFVTADDIAATAVFLASPAAARISGQMIAVDGHTENPDPKV